ncbi:hypothetical protein EII17_05250 [Clostridiales bacterium COT073_COT-073]|nr:hypothetical protein EII17_05250 [Clostridiales bacterium COT073_COT-073]
MKCPNCSTSLDIDAEICFACGEEITEEVRQTQDKEFDEVIQNLILTEEAEQDEEELESRLAWRKQENLKKEKAIRNYRYTSFAAMAAIVLFLISLFLNWYTISGTVAYHGYFYTATTGKYLSEGVKAYARDKLIDQNQEVAAFSPNHFLTYAKEYEDNSDIHGLLAKLQIYYAKGLYLVYFLILACLLILVFDKKGKLAEVIRVSSILSVIFVLLNTLAMKLPYINLIVLNAKRVLSANGIASTVVSKGLYLYESTKQNLTYQVKLNTGWTLAVVFVALWFVLATVLMEMSRSFKEN